MKNQSAPKIIEGRHYTVIIEFDIEPAKQLELIEGITAEVERLFSPHPAFISASFHSSFDGRRVVNYAQWTGKDAYEAFMEEVGTPQSTIGEVVKRTGAKPVYSNAYRVERVITSNG
jgi:hypothetical protein